MRSSDDAIAGRVAGFIEGRDSIPYDGIVVCPDPRRKVVLVLSYTDMPEEIRPTKTEALSKINRSREVLEALKSSYPSFALAVKDATFRFEFCRDYGKGAYALAWMDGVELEWMGGGPGDR
jgi:hypothetical protein